MPEYTVTLIEPDTLDQDGEWFYEGPELPEQDEEITIRSRESPRTLHALVGSLGKHHLGYPVIGVYPIDE